jgi:hypoxanthine phosphoribosyltransferase
MLAVLNGAFIFAGDLIRLLKVDAEVSFVKLKSYRGTVSTGEVQTLIGLMHELKDREVLIVEDIIDTGRTMSKLLEMVWEQSPTSVKVCTLLVKPDVFKNKYRLDYVGFSIPDKFVVGYGLDYDELGRQLPDIYKIKD